MACINSDGTLTPVAQKVLSAIQEPSDIYEINQKSGVALYRIRSNIRELIEFGLVTESNGRFVLTESGRARIN
jgi:predicted transcriptional regulator